MAFSPLRNSDRVVFSISIDFPSNSKRDVPFHCTAYHYSCVDCDGLRDHLRYVPWEDIFKLGAPAAGTEFYGLSRLKLMYYIPHRKYLIKLHSSP